MEVIIVPTADASALPGGEVWVAGSADGPGLAVTTDAAQRRFGGYSAPTGSGDAFLIRWSADGSVVHYATYLGGAGDDAATTLVSDGEGGAWVGGSTTSRDFPVGSNAPQRRLAGSEDGFLAHVDGRGRLVFATYVGGSGNDEIAAMVRLDDDRIALAGRTSSPNSGLGGPPRDGPDGFVALFDWRKQAVLWWRRLGGPGEDRLRSVTVLGNHLVVAAGDSDSGTCCRARGGRDAWVVAVSSRGDVKGDYCLGGARVDQINGVAAAGDGTVWVTGRTESSDFPRTINGLGNRPGGSDQAFVARLEPLRGITLFSTLLGIDGIPRAGIARGYAIAVAPDGTVFAAGETTSPDRYGNLGGLIEPTKGAFRDGQRLGSTDSYVVALR
jgi:hypothetical protein